MSIDVTSHIGPDTRRSPGARSPERPIGAHDTKRTAERPPRQIPGTWMWESALPPKALVAIGEQADIAPRVDGDQGAFSPHRSARASSWAFASTQPPSLRSAGCSFFQKGARVLRKSIT